MEINHSLPSLNRLSDLTKKAKGKKKLSSQQAKSQEKSLLDSAMFNPGNSHKKRKEGIKTIPGFDLFFFGGWGSF